MKSLLRIFAIMHKELLQLSRDRLTFGMIVGIPLISYCCSATPSTPTSAT